MLSWNIENGYGVYDTLEDRLGTVGEVQIDHFRMDTGPLGLGKDYFIPLSAVTDVREDRVYLRTTKERLESGDWDNKEAVLNAVANEVSEPRAPVGGS